MFEPRIDVYVPVLRYAVVAIITSKIKRSYCELLAHLNAYNQNLLIRKKWRCQKRFLNGIVKV